MSDWSEAGLPAPEREGYYYARNTGLLFESISVPIPGIIKTFKAPVDQFSITFRLNSSDLETVDSFLNDIQNHWFTIDLISLADSDLVEHSVRVIKESTVTNIGYDFWRLSLEVESRLSITAPSLASIECVPEITCCTADCFECCGNCEIVCPEIIQVLCTSPYPIEGIEELTTTAALESGFEIAVQIEPGVSAERAQLISADVVDVFYDVLAPLQGPDWVQAKRAALISIDVYSQFTDVLAAMQGPDTMQAGRARLISVSLSSAILLPTLVESLETNIVLIGE